MQMSHPRRLIFGHLSQRSSTKSISMKQSFTPVTIILLLASLFIVACRSSESTVAPTGKPFDGVQAVRTELYFGMRRRDNGVVGLRDWRKFVDSLITPRFPKGFTMIDANGQYQMADGKIKAEMAKVVVLIHDDTSVQSNTIDSIRKEYCTMYDQESVLRVSQYVWVSF